MTTLNPMTFAKWAGLTLTAAGLLAACTKEDPPVTEQVIGTYQLKTTRRDFRPGGPDTTYALPDRQVKITAINDTRLYFLELMPDYSGKTDSTLLFSINPADLDSFQLAYNPSRRTIRAQARGPLTAAGGGSVWTYYGVKQ